MKLKPLSYVTVIVWLVLVGHCFVAKASFAHPPSGSEPLHSHHCPSQDEQDESSDRDASGCHEEGCCQPLLASGQLDISELRVDVLPSDVPWRTVESDVLLHHVEIVYRPLTEADRPPSAGPSELLACLQVAPNSPPFA